jgi:hypothetical protein
MEDNDWCKRTPRIREPGSATAVADKTIRLCAAVANAAADAVQRVDVVSAIGEAATCSGPARQKLMAVIGETGGPIDLPWPAPTAKPSSLEENPLSSGTRGRTTRGGRPKHRSWAWAPAGGALHAVRRR